MKDMGGYMQVLGHSLEVSILTYSDSDAGKK